MDFNSRTLKYLQEMKAVKIDSKYKILQIDYTNLKAFVNKQDTYKKKNGKLCHVEHHFGRWIQFKKEDISYGMKQYTTYDSSFYGLEVCKGETVAKYLKPEVKKRLIMEYINGIKNSFI